MAATSAMPPWAVARVDGFDRSGGAIVQAEVRIDDSVVMLSAAAEGYPAVPSMLHLDVVDVDRAYTMALEVGASAVQAPRTHEGETQKPGMVVDPCGNTWVRSTQRPE